MFRYDLLKLHNAALSDKVKADKIYNSTVGKTFI